MSENKIHTMRRKKLIFFFNFLLQFLIIFQKNDTILFHFELSFDRGVDFETLTSTSGETLENVQSAHHFEIDFRSPRKISLYNSNFRVQHRSMI